MPKKSGSKPTKRASGRPPAKASKSAPKVLIADDQVTVARALKALFEERGFSASCAHNVDDTIAWLGKARFDVIVVDMRMPETQSGPPEQHAGLSVLRIVQSFGLNQEDAVVVLFTAYPSVSDCFAAIEAGAYYLPKALPGRNVSEELVDEIARIIDEKRQREREPNKTWLSLHFDELVDKFGGKTVAVVDLEAAKRNRLSGGTLIGDRRVFSAPSPEELQEKVIRDARFRRAMPLILDVLEENI